PYLRPLMRTLSGELRELLERILVKSGLEVDQRRIEQMIAVVDGAVANARIAVDPDPRGVAARMLRETLATALPLDPQRDPDGRDEDDMDDIRPIGDVCPRDVRSVRVPA